MLGSRVSQPMQACWITLGCRRAASSGVSSFSPHKRDLHQRMSFLTLSRLVQFCKKNMGPQQLYTKFLSITIAKGNR